MSSPLASKLRQPLALPGKEVLLDRLVIELQWQRLQPQGSELLLHQADGHLHFFDVVSLKRKLDLGRKGRAVEHALWVAEEALLGEG